MLVNYTGWLVMTALLIRRAVSDGRSSVPAMILPACLAWDMAVFAAPSATALFPATLPGAGIYRGFSRIWLPLDVVVLFVTLRGRDAPPRRGAFWPAFLSLFAACAAAAAVMMSASANAPALTHGWLALCVKTLWSAALLTSLLRSGDGRGQSLGAWAARFGLCTLAPYVIMGGFPIDGIAFASLICVDAALDAAYLPAYLAKRRAWAAPA